MKKRILATLMAAVLTSATLMLSACGSQETQGNAEQGGTQEQETDSDADESSAPEAEGAEKSGDGLTFCTIISNSSDYCKAEQAGAEALAAELGIGHITLNANSNAQTEVDAIQSAISQGVDGMFIHDIDITALGPAVQAALDAGIQVSCASTIREYLDEEYVNHELLFPIFWDEKDMGLQIGKMLVEKMEGDTKVLIISAQAGNNASNQRIAGFEEAIAGHDEIEVVNTVACDYDRALALTATEDALTANPDISCIFSVGEEMTWGVVEALENIGRDDILIGTADGSKTTMQMCIDGKIDVIGQEKAAAGAMAGLSVLNARANGESLEDCTGWYDFDTQTCSAAMFYFDQSNADLEQCDY